jgi:hypothetical protein
VAGLSSTACSAPVSAAGSAVDPTAAAVADWCKVVQQQLQTRCSVSYSTSNTAQCVLLHCSAVVYGATERPDILLMQQQQACSKETHVTDSSSVEHMQCICRRLS